MWELIMGEAIDSGQGIFVLLFIALLGTMFCLVRWVLKTNQSREKDMQETNNTRELRYIGVIEKQADALLSLNNIECDLRDIKGYLYRCEK